MASPPMKLSSWMLAIRPRTLSLSTTPVVVETALAWVIDRQVHWLAALAALVGAIFIHVGTNLHNDATGPKRGGDGPDRFGPKRATASGLLKEAVVNRAAFACFAGAALVGGYLIWVGGWPIFLLGSASIVSGWAYNGGSFPISYTPFGEIFVVLFFGLGAVCGTYWLCTATLNSVAVEAGLALGSLTAAVLLVNNRRDLESDARVGRRTLPIIAGPAVTKGIYAALVLVPFGLLLPIGHTLSRGSAWPAFAVLPLAALLINRFVHESPGCGQNQILMQTVLLQTLFSLLLSAGLLL